MLSPNTIFFKFYIKIFWNVSKIFFIKIGAKTFFLEKSITIFLGTCKMNNVVKNDGRKISYHIISRLGAATVQKGRFVRPKIQLSLKVAKFAGYFGFYLDFIFCMNHFFLRFLVFETWSIFYFLLRFFFFWAGGFARDRLASTACFAKPGYAASLPNTQVSGIVKYKIDNNLKTKNRTKKHRNVKTPIRTMRIFNFLHFFLFT